MTGITRRRALALTASALASPIVARSVDAQEDFPAREIKVVCAYPPGSGADTLARYYAEGMKPFLSKPVIVENRAGANGNLAAGYLARSKPDGYTVMVDAASFVINQSLYPKLAYDAEKAFAPVGVLAAFPHVIVVTPGYEAKSAADLIARAKASPGAISYASSGTGSAQHLAGAAFIQQTKAEMTHVPYKGGGPAMNDVMGGHIPVFFANIASGLSHIKGGKLRALAVAGQSRVAALPDVPAIGELGLSGSAVYEWNGMFVPAGTPDAVIGKLADALNKALQAPEVKQRIADLGGELIGGGRDGAGKFIADQRAITARLIRDGNIKPD